MTTVNEGRHPTTGGQVGAHHRPREAARIETSPQTPAPGADQHTLGQDTGTSAPPTTPIDPVAGQVSFMSPEKVVAQIKAGTEVPIKQQVMAVNQMTPAQARQAINDLLQAGFDHDGMKFMAMLSLRSANYQVAANPLPQDSTDAEHPGFDLKDSNGVQYHLDTSQARATPPRYTVEVNIGGEITCTQPVADPTFLFRLGPGSANPRGSFGSATDHVHAFYEELAEHRGSPPVAPPPTGASGGAHALLPPTEIHLEAHAFAQDIGLIDLEEMTHDSSTPLDVRTGIHELSATVVASGKDIDDKSAELEAILNNADAKSLKPFLEKHGLKSTGDRANDVRALVKALVDGGDVDVGKVLAIIQKIRNSEGFKHMKRPEHEKMEHNLDRVEKLFKVKHEKLGRTAGLTDKEIHHRFNQLKAAVLAGKFEPKTYKFNPAIPDPGEPAPTAGQQSEAPAPEQGSAVPPPASHADSPPPAEEQAGRAELESPKARLPILPALQPQDSQPSGEPAKTGEPGSQQAAARIHVEHWQASQEQKGKQHDEEIKAAQEQVTDKKADERLKGAGLRQQTLHEQIHDKVSGAHQAVQQEAQERRRLGQEP